MTETLFFKPKYKYLSEVITLKTLIGAERSVEKLKFEYNNNVIYEKRLRIARAVQLASNRAFAIAKKTNISKSERKELILIGRLYDNLAKKMFLNLKF